jgi:hypothetical protein
VLITQIKPPRRLIALTDGGPDDDVILNMNEAVFLVVLGAFAILYAAGWLAISLPKRERREALRRDHRP